MPPVKIGGRGSNKEAMIKTSKYNLHLKKNKKRERKMKALEKSQNRRRSHREDRLRSSKILGSC